MNKYRLIIRLYNEEIKKYWKEKFLIFFFIIVSAISTSAVAWLLDPAIKTIFLEKNRTYLFAIPLLIIFAFIVKSLSTYIIRTKTISISYGIAKSVQIQMGKKIIYSDTSFINNKHSGKIISSLTNDIAILINTLNNVIINTFKEFFTLIVLIALMIYQNWQLSVMALTIMPVAALVAKKIGKKMGRAVNTMLQTFDDFTKVLSEILRAIAVIKIFQQEKKQLKKFSESIEDRMSKGMKVEKTRLRTAPFLETITGFAIALVVFAGGYQSLNDQIEIGTFFSFLTAMMLAYQPVRALAGFNIGINEGLAALKRIYELIDRKNLIKNEENCKELIISNKQILFSNVKFSYPDGTLAINNISCKIDGGSKVAIVGRSGAGKTTLINLIPRIYNTTEGDIFIDNQNIKNVKIDSLRQQISLVSQEIILFDDTIKENILQGKIDAHESEIIEACKLAAADEFIQKMPAKYETIVGENGVKLSGGQKQRLSIARAILRDSSIILLDEPTSALDNESEKKIQDAINNLIKNKTTIIIAHKLSTILNMDKIIVLKNGIIEAEGNHEYLLKNSKTYSKLYNEELKKK